MKRILIGLAALVFGVVVAGGPAVAVDEHAPHGGRSHPHHVHHADGGCTDHPVDMEGGSRGLHHGANQSGHHGMSHGTCEGHVHSA